MGQNERKQQEKEIKRQDILDAAERVFFSKGYETASMDEVAKEAEFSKRTVYVYFNSKEQIYFEIMARGYQVLIGMMEKNRAESHSQNALDELHDIFFTFFEFSRRYPEYFKAIMEYETTNSNDSSVGGSASKVECYRLGEQIFGYLSEALKRGVAEGTLRRELDSESAALTLWACTVGVYNTVNKKANYLKEYHQVEPENFVTESFHLFMHLIRAKE